MEFAYMLRPAFDREFPDVASKMTMRSFASFSGRRMG